MNAKQLFMICDVLYHAFFFVKYFNVGTACSFNTWEILLFLIQSNYVIILQGDFLVHFMDISRDELTKKIDEISVEKLQVVLFSLFFFIIKCLEAHNFSIIILAT